jgi:ABC-type sugar transport system ATPase subunit
MNRRPEPLLELSAVRKAFPGVQAIRAADLDLYAGEIHALVGENGAGKSTLIKILTGALRRDAGGIRLEGRAVEFRHPLQARRAGIAAIYQEFTLIPALTVRENLFLGREKTRGGILDPAYERRQARRILENLGVDLPVDTPVCRLNVAQQQLVEIARALTTDARILVMDEPTAALTPREVENLFGILRGLAKSGIGILFISHRLSEVFEIADRVTVMRDGSTIGTWRKADITREKLIERMVGRPLDQEFPKARISPGEPCLEVKHLSGGKVQDVTFTVRHGEVLGLAGLMGAGRSEVARMIFGADPRASGEIRLDRKTLRIRSPRDAVRQGICLLTEDRKAQGLVLQASAKDNFALSNLSAWSKFGWIQRGRELSRFFQRVQELNIRIAHPDQPARNLSGGNQQKLLVARWLENDSQVVIFDEPTRGIDVGAKYEMYLLINDLAARGKAVLMISSELPEILGMSDRILVMREGRISGEIPQPDQATQEEVMALAI